MENHRPVEDELEYPDISRGKSGVRIPSAPPGYTIGRTCTLRLITMTRHKCVFDASAGNGKSVLGDC